MRASNSIFNIALSCSIFWHMACFQAVNIVWPHRLEATNFAELNFWGPILETSDSMPAIVPAAGSSEDLLSKPKAGGILREDTALMKKEALPLDELSEKLVPQFKMDTAAERFLVTEKVDQQLNRSVIFKPLLPDYPEWARSVVGEFEVELKFRILGDGTISSIEKISSSGYSELDEIGIRYLRKWKFVALPAESVSADKWGVIKLVFKLR